MFSKGLQAEILSDNFPNINLPIRPNFIIKVCGILKANASIDIVKDGCVDVCLEYLYV